MPLELQRLMASASSLELGERTLDFSAPFASASGSEHPDSPWRLFPRQLILGTGPDGERYIADLSRPDRPDMPILGIWPSPPVVILVARNLAEFLTDIARTLPVQSDGSQRSFDPFQRSTRRCSALFRLMDADPHLHSRRVTQKRCDPVMATFAEPLPPGTRFCDLRDMKPGMGFAWAHRHRFNAFHRHPTELVFAPTLERWHWRPMQLLFNRSSKQERLRAAALFENRL